MEKRRTKGRKEGELRCSLLFAGCFLRHLFFILIRPVFDVSKYIEEAMSRTRGKKSGRKGFEPQRVAALVGSTRLTVTVLVSLRLKASTHDFISPY